VAEKPKTQPGNNGGTLRRGSQRKPNGDGQNKGQKRLPEPIRNAMRAHTEDGLEFLSKVALKGIKIDAVDRQGLPIKRRPTLDERLAIFKHFAQYGLGTKIDESMINPIMKLYQNVDRNRITGKAEPPDPGRE
jgi:hypothetical protein